MTANELDPSGAGGSTGQGGSISSAAPSNSPGGAADLDLDAITHSRSTVDVDAVLAAWRDPDYVRRLALDAQQRDMVEVDNPMRPELRPRRGTESATEATKESRPVVGLVAHVVDLDAIEARADAATVGPWSFYVGDLWRGVTAEELDRADRLTIEHNFSDEAEDIFERSGRLFHGDVERPEDAAFIAAARTDVPALVAEVRALRAEVAVLKAETRARCERIRAVLDRK